VVSSFQDLRDNVGDVDNSRNILFLRNKESINIEENSTKIWTRDTSTDVIWGRENWGSPNKWDGSYANSFVLAQVLNPNDLFRENFRDTAFEDTSNTTADWDVTNFQLSFTTGEVAQSSEIYKQTRTISKATMEVTATDPSLIATTLTLALSTDGSSFETVTNSTEHTFATTGNKLFFKLTASGSITITKIIVGYS